jgi:hypothetical protein
MSPDAGLDVGRDVFCVHRSERRGGELHSARQRGMRAALGRTVDIVNRIGVTLDTVRRTVDDPPASRSASVYSRMASCVIPFFM